MAGMETPVFLTRSPMWSRSKAVADLRSTVGRPAGRPNLISVSEGDDARSMRLSGGTLLLRAHLLDAIGEAVVAIDADGAVLCMNAAAEELYGCSSTWAEGRTAVDILAWDLPDDIVARMVRCSPDATEWTGDVVVRSEAPRRVCVAIAPVRVAGDVVAMVATARDDGERQIARAALLRHLTHDEGTGLLNRKGAVARIDELLRERVAEDRPMVVIRFDLDGLRPISEAFGEEAARTVNRSVAHDVARAAHTGDIVARTSDASLLVCCPHLTGEPQAIELVDRLRQIATRPVAIDGNRVALRAAAGIVVDHEGALAEELLHRADIAVAHQREHGRTDATVYDDTLRHQILRQVDIEGMVRRAIATDEVALAYQPVVRIADQVIVGAEALLRMADGAGAPVAAPEVVGVAERTGLISDLGLVILRTACREAARWQHEHPERPIGVAVNVSASQLDDDAFPEHVAAALHATGLDPARLTLEMTEDVLMADSARSARQLARLKMIGVHLSADDFGTGYSSLAYLKRFPLDVIKADLSFVAGLPDSPEDVAIVSAIVAMANAVGLQVVAEGVENLRQLGELERLGCGFGQGYLWSRAVPGDELLALVEQGHEAAAPASTDEVTGAGPAGGDGLDLAFRAFVHEVRNPLSIVTGWAALLEGDDPDPAEAAEAGAHIRRAGERIDRLLVSLDDVVSLEEGRLRLDAGPVDLRELVGDLLDGMAPRLRSPVLFDRSASPSAVVHADAARVEQVVTNLVSNAVKFSPADAPVEVVLGLHGSWADVSVLDRGPGIAEQDVALVFRKFGRVDRTAVGTGMGLYLARGIARAHGGEVCYRRRGPDGGAIFNLRLPCSGSSSAPPGTFEGAFGPGPCT